MASPGEDPSATVQPFTDDRLGRCLQPFMLSQAQLETVRDLMLDNMERGLRNDYQNPSSIKMLPTFVRSTLNGKERWSSSH
ncbi:hypothetical protein FKM82_025228 [Ascaphus truei]